jgi:hypothetical protein
MLLRVLTKPSSTAIGCAFAAREVITARHRTSAVTRTRLESRSASRVAPVAHGRSFSVSVPRSLRLREVWPASPSPCWRRWRGIAYSHLLAAYCWGTLARPLRLNLGRVCPYPSTRPNRSFNRTANGRSPWPRGAFGSSCTARPRRPPAGGRLTLR